MIDTKLAFAIALALVLASSTSAQSAPPTATSQSDAKIANPNEIICEKLQVLGSRLAVKKYCLTRAQWESARLQDRQFIEKIQASPCVIQTTGASGRPSC